MCDGAGHDRDSLHRNELAAYTDQSFLCKGNSQRSRRQCQRYRPSNFFLVVEGVQPQGSGGEVKKDGWMWVAYCNYHLQLSPFVCRPLYRPEAQQALFELEEQGSSPSDL